MVVLPGGWCIACVLFGIYMIREHARVKALSVDEYSGTPPNRFVLWQRLELKGIHLFLLTSWGIFSLSVVVLTVALLTEDPRVNYAQIALFLLFIAGVAVSRCYSAKAAILEKRYSLYGAVRPRYDRPAKRKRYRR